MESSSLCKPCALLPVLSHADSCTFCKRMLSTAWNTQKPILKALIFKGITLFHSHGDKSFSKENTIFSFSWRPMSILTWPRWTAGRTKDSKPRSLQINFQSHPSLTLPFKMLCWSLMWSVFQSFGRHTWPSNKPLLAPDYFHESFSVFPEGKCFQNMKLCHFICIWVFVLYISSGLFP